MPRNEPLSPKPGGTGGYFWSVWADWNLVAIVGLVFVGLIAGFASVQFYFEDRNQQESFLAAAATLPLDDLEQRPTQRQAKLLKKASIYSWRAIVWVKENGARQPRIWHAEVAKEKSSFRCIGSEVLAYDREIAWKLELFDDVTAGK